MSERNKNGNDRLSDFLRYKRNKMTDRERNAFERKLQKDPFSEEASEGLEGIDLSFAEKDVADLRKQLKKRTTRKQRVLWYSIAASVTVLMILSSIFIFTEKRKPSEQFSYAPVTQQSKDLQTLNDQPAIQANVPAATIEKKLPTTIVPEKSIKSPAKTIENEIEPDEKPEIKMDLVSKVAESDQVFAADKALPSRSVRTIKKSDTITEFKPDTSEINLNEIVVVGYGARNTGKEDKEAVNQYNPPYPAAGRIDFDKYIRENIRRPDTTTAGQRVVVVLNFRVDAEGKIDSIRILRSPGKNFSDEAIRLIREGPVWKPAEENGTAISDEVRIRIVFK